MYVQIHRKMLEGLLEDTEGISKMPAASHLFTINENCTALKEDKSQFFHHLVAKLLYLCTTLDRFRQL